MTAFIELSSIERMSYIEARKALLRFHLSDGGRLALMEFTTQCRRQWIKLALDGRLLTRAYIEPPMDVPFFTITVSDSALLERIPPTGLLCAPLPRICVTRA